MNVTIQKDSLIRLSTAEGLAADEALALLQDELLRRLPLRFESGVYGNDVSGAALEIVLCDAETCPAELQGRLDPPPRILPYPDYAEHYHLSLHADRVAPQLVMLAGAPTGLRYAAGKLLQSILVYSDRVEVPPVNETWRPLNPLRGAIYRTSAPGPEALCEQALWGDNLAGLFTGSSEKLRAVASETRLKLAVSHGEGDIVCVNDLHALDGADSAEAWLETTGYNHDEIDTVLDSLHGDSAVRAVLHDPEDPGFAVVQRELPLTMQLAASCRLADAPPSELARRRAETAPLLYAALGSSTDEAEWTRFLWASISWAPITGLTEIFEAYGRCYFGAEAMGFIAEALHAIDEGRSAKEALDAAGIAVPESMRELAAPRLNELNQSA